MNTIPYKIRELSSFWNYRSTKKEIKIWHYETRPKIPQPLKQRALKVGHQVPKNIKRLIKRR